MGLTTELAEDLYAIQQLDDFDKAALRMLMVDFVAATYAGYKQNRSFNRAVEKVVFSQGGAAEATVFQQKQKYPVGKAAFMNAVYGHGAELDDGNKKAMGHIGVHVIPAVFALAEKLESTQDEVLVALATGYETYIRVSSAAQPGMLQRGFHSTGMAGTLACAAACARLYHLDARGIENAIALATTMTGGLLSYGDSRPAIKPLNPGKAAENGVFAAMLASEGIEGPTEALEGPNGWFHAVTEQVEKKLLKGSKRLLLHECYFKLYPSCRHTHCGIEAAINIHNKVDSTNIKKVKVFIYPNAIRLAGQIRYPKNKDETKFSIHYTMACALMNGSYGVRDMDHPDLSERITGMIEKIHLVADESMENRERAIRGTRLEAELTTGQIIKEIVLVPKGDPENPLELADIVKKLHTCALSQADDACLEQLVKAILEVGGQAQFVNPLALALAV